MPTLHDPVAFDLFGLTIRWYALFILLGIAASLTVSSRLARARELDPEFLLDVAPWVVLAAIVGARAYYVLLRIGHFADHPGEIVNVRLGGLTIHGALAVGVAVFWWFCRRRSQPFLTWGDIVITGVPFGQAIGRWGNWANQEAFGRPTDLPWAVHIDPDRRPAGYLQFSTFHPTFLYESVLDLLIGLALIWLVLRMRESGRLLAGDAIWAYLVAYGIARLAIESMRTDSLYIGPWRAAYWLSFVLIGIGLAGGIARHRSSGSPRPDCTAI